MPQRIVDQLETIQIHEQQCESMGIALGVRDGNSNAVCK
jgi:hypothetical protein